LRGYVGRVAVVGNEVDQERRALLGGALAAATMPARARESHTMVIDVHTHMYTRGWQQAVHNANDPHIKLTPGPNGADSMFYMWSSVGVLGNEMFDWELRIRKMDEAGVDLALISLSSPNVFLVEREHSVKAARAANDDFAAAAAKYPARIRWMASLPWNFAPEAVAELRRAKDAGAVGICMLTNIAGNALTEAQYQPIWAKIESLGLPVFVHPTLPKVDYGLLVGGGGGALANAVGFTTETTLCFARMIFEGFLDRYPGLELIACHGGGTLPYLAARFDRVWEKMSGPSKPSKETPSHYIKHRLYYDAILYDEETLAHLMSYVDKDRVMYGSDYPFSLGDMAGIRERVDRLPPHDRAAVRSGNAIKLFELPVNARSESAV
jgi:aminocarboxymuconate-semialdehyde decarboxylase